MLSRGRRKGLCTLAKVSKTWASKPETDDEFEDVEIEETPDDDRQAPRHEPNAEAPAEVRRSERPPRV